jgi:hypothetical protein
MVNDHNQSNLTLEFVNSIKKLESLVLAKSSTNSTDLLTFDETKIFLNCSGSWLRKSVFEKTIPYKKLGKNLRFSRDELLGWLDDNSVKPQ